MFNQIIIAGNPIRDPELASLPDGSPAAKFSIASNTRYKRSNTETKKETLFIEVQVYGARAKPCKEYLSKGQPVLVEVETVSTHEYLKKLLISMYGEREILL